MCDRGVGGSDSVRLCPGGGGGGLFLARLELLLLGIWELGEKGEDDEGGARGRQTNTNKKTKTSCYEVMGRRSKDK